MNIATLVSSNNSLVVDYPLPRLDDELKAIVYDPDYKFFMLGPWEDGVDYDFSNDRLYKKTEGKIHASDYTGEVYFGDMFFLSGDKDVNIIYKATFIDGVFNKIAIESWETVDNGVRKVALQSAIKKIGQLRAMNGHWAVRYIYRPIYIPITLLFIITRNLIRFTFKTMDFCLEKIQKLLPAL